MQYLDQPLVVGQPVRVYKNLHRDCWSVQARIPGKGWRVVRHSEVVVLEGATFQVNEAGRQRVLVERKKNVHAFVYGRFVRLTDGPGDAPFGLSAHGPARVVTYNPFKAGHFVLHSERPDVAPVPASFAARVTMLHKVVWAEIEYPRRLDGAGVVFCDDCGRHIPEPEVFWFTDWKCPSEIYCDGCGGKHGFPHPHGEPVEDGWEPTDRYSEYEDPDGSVPEDWTCDGCGRLCPQDTLRPESDAPNAPWHCEPCRTTPHIEGWMVADTSTEPDF
jgi:hypothetical protein